MGRLEGVDVITSKALRGSMASVEFYDWRKTLTTFFRKIAVSLWDASVYSIP